MEAPQPEFIIRDREGQPVSAFASTMTQLQGPCLAACMPGQWLPNLNLHNVNRAHVTWSLAVEDPDKILAVLSTSAAIGNFDVTCARGGRFNARFYTPILQWTDVVDASVTTAPEGGCKVDAWSRSAGLCPASCIGAPLGSALCCYFPFLDNAKNLLHLQQLKEHVEKEMGVDVTETVLLKGSD
uniref:Uncharacterized protein n=1 Tax=Rhizochromulina marina TaxID=1034831 RepID=A0A7S2RBN2_9STRA|mmetsp:Transcript_14003/g.41062  ORF Transcript_14003/g.41062 Transcript_14003/m.41062 type:complete len:184 (+) Transcript_14003:43-594(+)|eukprot:CAMPEP_0118961478 /NCGR_PEP_ID=MMETSP1173-20130426/151_1 /TAXON_ID=1034831 /ORGANISM="Rhizochromulina marina cf, Strain CCMP1243" /LENGTH=183 /DNA_ID=CAMNT_0006909653 /DNA_START=32 /DNA_END=583 /DNA_ORIENTATION=+